MTAFAEQILKHFELDKYFTLIIGGNPDVRVLPKEIVAAILQTIPAEERRSAVMVGDRMFDLIGAKPMVSIPSPSLTVTAQRMNCAQKILLTSSTLLLNWQLCWG